MNRNLIVSLLSLMLLLEIEATVQKREMSCPPDQNICSKSLNYAETKQFECHNNCPSSYKCCPDSCFEHNICKKAVVNPEAHIKPKSLDNYMLENEEDCPIDQKICSTPLNVELTKEFICQVGLCPQGYKCCSDSCFYHKICKSSSITPPPEPSGCPHENKICSEPLDFEITKMFICPKDGCPQNYKCCPHSCFQHPVCQSAESVIPLPTSGATSTSATTEVDFDVDTRKIEVTTSSTTATTYTISTVATTIEESNEENDYDDNDQTSSTTTPRIESTLNISTGPTTVTTTVSTLGTIEHDSNEENDYDDNDKTTLTPIPLATTESRVESTLTTDIFNISTNITATTLSTIATTVGESDEENDDDNNDKVSTLIPSTTTESRVESTVATDIFNISTSTTTTTLSTVAITEDESDEENDDDDDNDETTSTLTPSTTTESRLTTVIFNISTSNMTTTLSTVATTVGESDEENDDDDNDEISTLIPSTTTESPVESTLATDISIISKFSTINVTVSFTTTSLATNISDSARVNSSIIDHTTPASTVSAEGNVSHIQNTTSSVDVDFTNQTEGSSYDDNVDYEDDSDYYDESDYDGSSSAIQETTTEKRGFFKLFK